MRPYAPSERVLREWFVSHEPRQLTDGTRRLGYPPDIVERERPLLLSATRGASASPSSGARRRASASRTRRPRRGTPTSSDATRRLLLRTGDAAWWAQHAEPRDLDLLREHVPEYRTSVADTLERLSVADACAPREFGAGHCGYATFLAAAAVQATSRAFEMLEHSLRPRRLVPHRIAVQEGPDGTQSCQASCDRP